MFGSNARYFNAKDLKKRFKKQKFKFLQQKMHFFTQICIIFGFLMSDSESVAKSTSETSSKPTIFKKIILTKIMHLAKFQIALAG